MSGTNGGGRYRFGLFEADAGTGELRRQGMRVKLNAQPFQMLVLLLERPGELLTREEIAQRLWADGSFVDYEHGVNSAVNRIREALGDSAASPRFVETLARRGYRFLAPVERIGGVMEASGSPSDGEQSAPTGAEEAKDQAEGLARYLATPEELPKTSPSLASVLFVLLQLMYLSFYISALANLGEIEDLLSAMPRATEIYLVILVTAVVLIPVRAFTLCAVLFRAPGIRAKLLRLWPLLLVMDVLWAMSPLLLLHHINFGLAMACTALLVYSPFTQRALVLMGAGEVERGGSASGSAG